MVSAGNDLQVSGSQIAAQDQLALRAGLDIRIQGAQELTEQSNSSTQSLSGFSASVLSGVSHGSNASTQTGTIDGVTQVASTLGGRNVAIEAGRDARIVARNVVAERDIAITARRNIDVLAATDTQSSTSASHSDQRGIGLVAGMAPRPTLYGAAQGAQDGNGTSRTAVTSLISANAGNLTMVAGLDPKYAGTGQGNIHTEGAELIAGDQVKLSGLAVKLDAATFSDDSAHHAESRSLTLGSQLTGTVGGQITRIHDQAQAAQAITDHRLQGALAVKAAYDGYKLLGSNALGAGLADAGQAGTGGDPAGAGFGVSASISSTRNRQDSTDRSATQRGTSVQAGRIDITAREGDITATGVKLQGRDITLDAQRDIDLIAAANTAQTQSSNSGSSAGLGVTAGVGSQNGISFQVSASRSQGHGNGSETHYDNSLVMATHALTLRSGGDTRLSGAQVSAEQIQANIGGDPHGDTCIGLRADRGELYRRQQRHDGQHQPRWNTVRQCAEHFCERGAGRRGIDLLVHEYQVDRPAPGPRQGFHRQRRGRRYSQ